MQRKTALIISNIVVDIMILTVASFGLSYVSIRIGYEIDITTMIVALIALRLTRAFIFAKEVKDETDS